MNLLIFGPPGAGKGTQAILIAKKYKLTHLSSGDILRSALKIGALGSEIKKYQDAGKLVPDKLIIEIMDRAIAKNFRKGGFIFDGYPRTLRQARSLDKFLKTQKIIVDAVLNLKLSETQALRRILKRGKTSGRSDDNARIIKARFAVYRAQTAPLLTYYKKRKKVINIDGRLPITEVFKDIGRCLNNRFFNNHK